MLMNVFDFQHGLILVFYSNDSPKCTVADMVMGHTDRLTDGLQPLLYARHININTVSAHRRVTFKAAQTWNFLI